MKTDSIFYRIFKTDPGILFELLGQSPEAAQGYEFKSVEIKQVAFRLDGVFLPTPEAVDQTVWFVEVQFQRDPVFYQRFFSEIYLYLNLHPDTIDWQAVVIYPKRSIEPDYPHVFRANLNSDQVHRVYLEDLEEAVDSLGVGLMQLIVADSAKTVTQAQALLSRAQSQEQTNPRFAAIMELIETIVVYKFPQLSREEIESMLGLSELKQTKVYQEALNEGEQTGEARLVLRQLTRRIGDVAPELRSQIQALSLDQIESLGEALLDFSEPADLVQWLRGNRSE
ncbi:Rpn family recombination-promoting nuclease/putative transposase [Acaryochloris sp. CCMEE 5410]|uniref:Rpn family recombination-promoting nuclease/putative transposase n=1 Tax=Acaryochloris sp. CCMEE 5410 TaxID=310037 RepID=UPI00024840BE|nr:Rpn family recombination-promoting nuclease/putative transposase [Acaryochloris sp. CCMEE 5410]KAI9130004.1 Rpn family recombination-promoting nuclease/putative transposase [Acaryochloris sp. CCMEE 5410]